MTMTDVHDIVAPHEAISNSDSTSGPEWEDILGEETQLLSELVPDDLALYKHYFVTYWRKNGYHVKRSYESGFVQPKSRKTGKPLYLFNIDDALERHLDYPRYAAHYYAHDREKFDKYIKTDEQLFWLGLYGGKRTSVECLDVDNKEPGITKKERIAGWYQLTPNGPKMPVMKVGAAFIQAIKKIHEHYPERIWAISSESLGIYAWRKYDHPVTTERMRRHRLRQLKSMGLAEVEVFPNEGRCFRRPFGAHYRTIVHGGVLTDWQDQLSYFHQPGPTPSFADILAVLEAAQEQQWTRWKMFTGSSVDVASLKDEWFRAIGKRTQITSTSIPIITRPTIPIKPTPSLFDYDFMRHGRWPIALEELAHKGLPCSGSLGPVVHELAKWLFHIELYYEPEQQRKAKIIKLLKNYVNTKHNGTSSRTTTKEGRAEIASQIERNVELAIKLDPGERSKSLELFARIRQKRTQRKYATLIYLEGVLQGQEVPTSSSSSRLLSMCMRFDPLPAPMEKAIKKVAGRVQVMAFATKLLNLLHDNKGSLNLGRKQLADMLGYKDPNRIQKYRQVLIDAGLLRLGSAYSAGAFAKRHSLTREAKQMFEKAKERKEEKYA
jgi:hypothetical protein